MVQNVYKITCNYCILRPLGEIAYLRILLLDFWNTSFNRLKPNQSEKWIIICISVYGAQRNEKTTLNLEKRFLEKIPWEGLSTCFTDCLLTWKMHAHSQHFIWVIKLDNFLSQFSLHLFQVNCVQCDVNRNQGYKS